MKTVLVLVVADNDLVRDTVRDNLIDDGFEVVVAAAWQDAIATIENRSSDLDVIVTDIQFDGKVAGWNVANRARELNEGVAVIYMTGAATHDWPLQGVPDSILLLKPFAYSHLKRALSHLTAVPIAAEWS